MPFIIVEPCVGTCDTACVDVCPVDCIHGPYDKEGSGEEAKAEELAKMNIRVKGDTNFNEFVQSKQRDAVIETQIDAKAGLASPTFTGNPVAPTQSAGNNSTRIATTAFVEAATPYTAQTVKGMAKMWVSGGNLYITTS